MGNNSVMCLGDDAPKNRYFIKFSDLTETIEKENLTKLELRENKIVIDEENNEIKASFRIDIDYLILNTLDKLREVINFTHVIFDVNFLASNSTTPCRCLSYYIENLKYSLIPFDGKLELTLDDNTFMNVYVTFKVKEKA